MLIFVLSIFIFVCIALTQIFTLIPVHVLQFGSLPTWSLGVLVAIAFSWFMSD